MGKPIRQPVTAATIAAAVASAADAGTAGAPVTEAPIADTAADAPKADEQAQAGQAQAAVDEGSDEPVEGRVLIAFDDYAPNDIFVGPRDETDELERAQKIDCDPKAVAYAKSLIEG